MKQALAGRSSSVSPPRRKLTGGIDRAGYAPKENTNQPDTPASDRELVLTRPWACSSTLRSASWP